MTIELELPKLRIDQAAIVSHPAKVKVLAMGRRWGKSTMGGVVVMNVLRQHGRVAWVVPEYKNGRSLWRYASSVCAPLAQAGYMSISKSERVITTHAGGYFAIYSGDNIDAIRSEAFNLLVGDEAARIDGDGWQDAARPTLADADGDEILISTPKGKNWFFNEWIRGQSGKSGYMSWNAPTNANPIPNIRKAFDMARERVSDRTYRQEWLAEFVDDGALFMNVAACAVGVEKEPEENHSYVIGVDWARASGGDSTVFMVVDAVTKSVSKMVRMNGAAFDTQLARLRDLWNEYKQGSIIAEYNSLGMPLVERLQTEGLPVTAFTTTAASKHEIITALELAFDKQEITVLNDPVLIGELNSYERKERAGLPSYSAPDGMHDDCVMALALAWHGVVNNYDPSKIVDWV